MKTFVEVWTYVGAPAFAVLGAVVGGFLTMWYQKTHWVADSKKAEYRELIEALTRAGFEILDFRSPKVEHAPEEERAEHEAEWRALAVIGSRLFIAEEVEKMEIMKRWRDAVFAFKEAADSGEFARAFREIVRDITTTAQKLMK